MLLILILHRFQIIRCFGFPRYITFTMQIHCKTRKDMEGVYASAELQKFYVLFVLCLIVSSGFGKNMF